MAGDVAEDFVEVEEWEVSGLQVKSTNLKIRHYKCKIKIPATCSAGIFILREEKY